MRPEAIRKTADAYSTLSESANMRRYREFYSKDASAEFFMGRGGSVSEKCLLGGKLLVDSPLSEDGCRYAIPLNYPFDLHRFIRNHERDKLFVVEGEISTYPVEKLHGGYVATCRKLLPNELCRLSAADCSTDSRFGGLDKHKSILDYFSANATSDIATFVFPMYDSDAEGGGLSRFLAKLSDSLYLYGYAFALVSKLPQNSTVQSLERPYSLYVVQFDAKYPKGSELDAEDVLSKLGGKLYHVSPSRYFTKIAKNGLVPLSKSGKFGYDDRVYLFNELNDEAFAYGAMKAYELGKEEPLPSYYGLSDGEFCVFTVDTKRLLASEAYKSDKLTFYTDPRYGSFSREGRPFSIFTKSGIPTSILDDSVEFVKYDASGNGERFVHSRTESISDYLNRKYTR